MDVVWTHVFDKPESSGEKNKDDADPEDNMRKEKAILTDTHTGAYVPMVHQSSSHGPRFRQHTPPLGRGYHHRLEGPLFMDRTERMESQMDDAARRVRVEVPDYDRKLEPHTFQDWITSLKDYFDWSGLSLDRQVRFAKMKLKGQARVWWQSVEERLYHLRLPPIADWDEMKMMLQEKYLLLDYEDSLFEELILLRQGSMTVDEYTNKFHDLSTRSQISETGRQTLARFKAGLGEDIRKELLTIYV